MATTKKKKAAGAPAKPAAKKAATTEPERPEFLVVTVPDKAKEGSTFRLLHVASSLKEAEDYVGELSGTSARYFGILEKKAVLRRAPVMQTSNAERNILSN